MSRPLRAIIHTQSLQHNLQRVRDFAPDAKVMAVIKAGGYGHGIVTAAKTLSKSKNGADALAVASIDEAIIVDDALSGTSSVCLLEGIFKQDELEEAIDRKFTLVVHNREQVEFLENISASDPVNIWLKINTGMNRLGIDSAEFGQAYERLRNCSAVSSIGVLSHLACADDARDSMTADQLAQFKKLDAGKDCKRSLANSAGIVHWPDTHFDWVRPGIMLYGSSPMLDKSAAELDLAPVMTLASELVAVRSVKKGATVGYGAAWTADKDTTVGVVACGYGDGYPRHAGAGTPVLVNNKRVAIVGRVSMDMITVDLSSQPSAQVGDPVVLWGEGLPVDEIATHANTIAYEILCQVTPRVAREIDPGNLNTETN